MNLFLSFIFYFLFFFFADFTQRNLLFLDYITPQITLVSLAYFSAYHPSLKACLALALVSLIGPDLNGIQGTLLLYLSLFLTSEALRSILRTNSFNLFVTFVFVFSSITPFFTVLFSWVFDEVPISSIDWIQWLGQTLLTLALSPIVFFVSRIAMKLKENYFAVSRTK